MAYSDGELNKPVAERCVAICIPAYGDPEGLTATLASIAAVEHARELMQVVVAVDGPDTALEAAARAGGADEVVVLDRNAGSYAARNAAIARVAPTSQAVLFTDSDAKVDRGWVDAHLVALERGPRSGGAVAFRLSDPPRPAEIVDARRHLNQRHYVQNLGYAATVNLAVRPEVLDKVTFDPSLRSGRDYEFGARCQAAGFPIMWTPEALVTHSARTTTRELLRKIDRVALGARALRGGGHVAAARRNERQPLREAAEAYGYRPSVRWLAEAWLVDRACSLAFARRNPSVVGPAIRRRVRRLAGVR